MDKQISEAPTKKSWGALADEAMHNPYVDLAVGAAVGAAVVLSRGKLSGAAENLFPRASALLGESMKAGEATTSLAPETLMSSRIFSRSTEELSSLANSARVAPHVLDSLTEHFSPSVLEKVAQNKLTTASSLEKLADSPAFTPFIAKGIAGNANASGDLLGRLAEHAPEEVAWHPNALPETLTKILSDDSASGQSILGAALNPNTPLQSLELLPMKPDFGSVAPEARDAVVKRLVVNPDTSPQTLHALADLTYTLPSKLRRQIAEHPNASAESLDRLSTDLNGAVRHAVRIHPNTSPETHAVLDDRALNAPPAARLRQVLPGQALAAGMMVGMPTREQQLAAIAKGIPGL